MGCPLLVYLAIRQIAVVSSTAEAEYTPTSNTSRNLHWIARIASKLHMPSVNDPHLDDGIMKLSTVSRIFKKNRRCRCHDRLRANKYHPVYGHMYKFSPRADTQWNDTHRTWRY